MSAEWDLRIEQVAGDRAAEHIRQLHLQIIAAEEKVESLEREAREWFCACLASLEAIATLEAQLEAARATAINQAEARLDYDRSVEPGDWVNGITLGAPHDYEGEGTA